jgi:putative oxidoreductase
MKKLETMFVHFHAFGLLLLRTSIGALMFYGHGWEKMTNFSAKAATFPDPLGLGSNLSLTLVVGAEFICPVLIFFGAMTRLAAIPLAIAMLVAAFVVHSADPWMKQEFALLYAIPAITLIFTGAGAWSMDALFFRAKDRVR